MSLLQSKILSFLIVKIIILIIETIKKRKLMFETLFIKLFESILSVKIDFAMQLESFYLFTKTQL